MLRALDLYVKEVLILITLCGSHYFHHYNYSHFTNRSLSLEKLIILSEVTEPVSTEIGIQIRWNCV